MNDTSLLSTVLKRYCVLPTCSFELGIKVLTRSSHPPALNSIKCIKHTHTCEHWNVVKSNEKKRNRMWWKEKQLARDLIGVCTCMCVGGGSITWTAADHQGQLGQLFWLRSHEIHQRWESVIDNITVHCFWGVSWVWWSQRKNNVGNITGSSGAAPQKQF